MNTIRPHFRILSPSQIEQIHQNSLKILDKTGIRIDSERARNLMLKAGCRSKTDLIITIPEELVEFALKAAPDHIDIFNRNGTKAFRLGPNSNDQPVFGIGVTNLWFQEIETNQMVPFRRKHNQLAARLGQALSNFSIISTPGVPQDVPQNMVDLYSTLDMVGNTSKPLIILISQSNQFRRVLELLSYVQGDLKKRPFILPYFNPITPLVLNQETTDHIYISIEFELPFIYSSYGMAGATSPMPAASSLAMLNAELLAGLVFSQLVKQGAELIMGFLPAGFDMQTATSLYTPQSILLNLACAEMMHHYRLPHAGTSGSGPGWGADLLASGMLWLNHLTSCLGKVGLAPFVGGNFDSLTFSPTTVVYADQIIKETRLFSKGFEVKEWQIALDEIQEVGPGGNFLTSRLTLQNLEEVQARLKGIWPIYSLEKWQNNDSPTIDRILKEHTKNLLESVKPPDDHDEILTCGQEFIDRL